MDLFTRPLSESHEKHVETLKKKLKLSGTQREDWWREEDGGEHEVTFAFDPFERLLLRYQGERGWAADVWKKSFDGRRWVTGTIDWLQGRWVDDLKTGSFPVDAVTSGQLRTYAIVPWMDEGCPFGWDEPVSITQWAKYPLGAGPVRTPYHHLTGFDLEEHLDAICWTLTHPNEVNVVDINCGNCGQLGHSHWRCPNPYVPDVATEKMSPCTFCECREPHPASEWMSNFEHRTLPLCMPGLLKRIERH